MNEIRNTQSLELKALKLEETYERKLKQNNLRGAGKLKHKLDHLWDKIQYYEKLNNTSVYKIKSR
jgi:benzoyl-CoA reductase/2-hydroxyglutaryl-CoA dehydratase subunit BcrC/BadD/HgdB